ncbi:hypothetical protein [Streptomyces huiliensis]|uniref:hypothetical protein n=1 Tax=Streptomyces huiliensis TaxID=2876027 RepID=UPI001CBE487D|nr:hypothetical protein [Streptomyces huiliensis]MBZ4323536.1 hypothetical protein [Streptomyces huiliensis]
MTETQDHDDGPRNGDATFEELRSRAVALRRKGLSTRRIGEELGIGSHDLLTRLLRGEPAPEWTKRPRAKDALREQARDLRLAGKTYDEITAELGVSKSSVSLWVRDLPKPRKTPEQLHAMREARWEPHRREVAAKRVRTRLDAACEIGRMTERELFLLGVGLYWAEGAKSKPYQVREAVHFINSDPDVIQVYQAWLTLLEIGPDRVRYRVMIHESADVAAAEAYWAKLVGVDVSSLCKTTLKRHNPKTVRKNTGSGYRGCLVVQVLQGADLYRRIEGWWYGIVLGVKQDHLAVRPF